MAKLAALVLIGCGSTEEATSGPDLGQPGLDTADTSSGADASDATPAVDTSSESPPLCGEMCSTAANFVDSETIVLTLKAKGAQKTFVVDGADVILNVSMYNGLLPGPTVEVRTPMSSPAVPPSGDTLILDVTNDGGLNTCCYERCADPLKPKGCWAHYCHGVDLEDGDACKQVDADTNIHTHGLHIGSATANLGPADVCAFTGTDPTNPELPWDNVFVTLPAFGATEVAACTGNMTCTTTKRQSFSYPLPPRADSHALQPDAIMTPHWFGLQWYHPHAHHTSQDQLRRGLAGALVVRNPAEQAIPSLAGLAKDSERIVILQALPMDVDETPKPRLRVVNGKVKPEMTIKAGETQRWRLLNATSDSAVQFSLVNTAEQSTLPFHPIGLDGIPTSEILPALQSYFIMPGSRFEVLVTAPTSAKAGDVYNVTWCEPATDIYHSPEDELQPDAACTGESVVAATVKVVAGDATPVAFEAGDTFADLASFGLEPDLWSKTPDKTRTIKFTQSFSVQDGPTFAIDTGDGNGSVHFDSGQVCDAPVESHLDTIEEWIIENWTTDLHTFHLHVNPFQVDPSQMSAKLGAKPLYQDNIVLPLGKSANNPRSPNEASEPGVITIRVRFTDYIGTTVFHCHLLEHEDHGMMSTITVLPAE